MAIEVNRPYLVRPTPFQLAAEFRDDSVKDSAQRHQRDRTENPLGQNVPGDGFVLKVALENLVSKEEGIDADHKHNQGSGHGDQLNRFHRSDVMATVRRPKPNLSRI